ncbi:hypothetical protein [Novosphingobium marinum]|uniref:Uncharacterized protein n=1 Tax=Novosphingobium marinum TaxID=1514948 RepID=A0A7Y9XZT8_9SPHN|nr:hypothetical protein [Novosphingobium marinum]NYH96133.1 hypothetical protein [Novosphingobium marinum]
MYEFVDRPLARMDYGARFLVFSMRMWVSSLGRKQCPASAVAPGFAKWGMMAGLQAFHRAMLLLNRDGLEQLGFCSLKCNHVSEHEAILLTLACDLGEGRAAHARETLALIVAEDSVEDVLAGIAQTVAAMGTARIAPQRPALAPRDSDRG